ncbi:MAG: DUF3592 domain-containing protein [Tepidisphaerales bacterium]
MGRVIALLILGVLSFAAIMTWSSLLGQAVEHHAFLGRARPADGELLSIHTPPAGSKSGSHVRVVYRYVPGPGQRLEGTTLRLGERLDVLGWGLPNAPLPRPEAEQVAQRFRPGPVTVYFDPERPERAVLDLHRPAAPLIGMGLLGLLTGILGAGAMATLTSTTRRPLPLAEGWVKLPPTWSLQAAALGWGTAAAIALVMAAPPAAVLLLGEPRSGAGFWLPVGTLAASGLLAATGVYHGWRWRRVARGELHLRAAGGRATGVARGEPFELKLCFESRQALISGGSLRVVHQKHVTTGSGKNRRSEWVTQTEWTSDLPQPAGPERALTAVAAFTIPTDRPPTTHSDRYRIRPHVRLAFGPDYRQEFDLQVS